jgi:hypothetical protein
MHAAKPFFIVGERRRKTGSLEMERDGAEAA